MMWVFIGLFYQYRAVIARNSGPAYEDGKWTFGQVLSMATWAPVAVDLVAVYLCEHLLTPPPAIRFANLPVVGAEKGLSSKLTRRYKVVAVPFRVGLPYGKESKPSLGKSLNPGPLLGEMDQLGSNNESTDREGG